MDALTSTAPDRASIEKRLQGLESLLYHDKQCSSLYHGLAADICEDFLAFANNIPQWKPIAEMPEELTRDGSRFFVWAEGVPPMVTEIFGGDMKQDGEEYRFLQFEPTHFMDCVPKPPATAPRRSPLQKSTRRFGRHTRTDNQGKTMNKELAQEILQGGWTL